METAILRKCEQHMKGYCVNAFVNFRILFFILVSIAASQAATAQFSTGTWREHLPYNKMIDVCYDASNTIYAATPYAVLVYDQTTSEVERLSKVNRLSDVGISAIEFDPTSGAVVVGYKNGNLDFLFTDSQTNLPDIKLSNIIGNKEIYDIQPHNGLLYLSTGFGIVVVDVAAMEVRSTYFIGSGGTQVKINDVLIVNNDIYAVADTVVWKANVTDPFLANFQNWNVVTTLPGTGKYYDMAYFANQIFLHRVGDTNDVFWKQDLTTGEWSHFMEYDGLHYGRMWNSSKYICFPGQWVAQCYDNEMFIAYSLTSMAGEQVAPNMVLRDGLNNLWVADSYRGLIGKRNNGEEPVIMPDGPHDVNVHKLGAYNSNLWIAHGGLYSYGGNMWNRAWLSGRVGDTWQVIDPGNGSNATTGMFDIIDVAVDPIDNNHIMFGSWEEGLVEKKADGSVHSYNVGTGDNPMQSADFSWAPQWTGVGGVSYDANGILWYSNSYSTKPIQALDRAGHFYSFSGAPYVSNSDWLLDVMATREGQIWAIVEGKGILVLDPNGTVSTTSDDNFTLLTEVQGNGKLIDKSVNCMIEDLDGEIWVGTIQGLCVFYSQESLFSDSPIDAEPILITQDGNVQILLGTETINAIEIDGGNRKWIATQNSGVYFFSADGLTQLAHYTKDNSPLPSNAVSDIAINHDNGEVFFATESGIVSLFSTATNFDQEMKNVRVFPNPVNPDFDGNITVDGLAYNSSIRITDVAGRVVYQGTSEGGRAFWNGKTTEGERPATGVYYVFCSNPDGKTTDVLQLTIIH